MGKSLDPRFHLPENIQRMLMHMDAELSALEKSPPPSSRTLLHVGGPLNALVYRVVDLDGSVHVEKSFAAKSPAVRATLGRLLVAREVRVLLRLASTGIVPQGVRRLSPWSFREDFCPGFALRDSCCGAYASNKVDPSKVSGVPVSLLLQPVPRSFFEALERGVRAAHRAGWVHLDLHNSRNVLVGPDWRPCLLDWQSAIPVSRLPAPLRRRLESIDLSGVYKFWDKFRPGELTPDRLALLRRVSFFRRFWFPRFHWIGGKDKPRP